MLPGMLLLLHFPRRNRDTPKFSKIKSLLRLPDLLKDCTNLLNLSFMPNRRENDELSTVSTEFSTYVLKKWVIMTRIFKIL
jgi:hypothetical protein